MARNTTRYVLGEDRQRVVKFDPATQRWKLWANGAFGTVVARANVFDTTTNGVPAVPARANNAPEATPPVDTTPAAEPVVLQEPQERPEPTITRVRATERPVSSPPTGEPAPTATQQAGTASTMSGDDGMKVMFGVAAVIAVGAIAYYFIAGPGSSPKVAPLTGDNITGPSVFTGAITGVSGGTWVNSPRDTGDKWKPRKTPTDTGKGC
ncbi:hypothetical protein COB52_03945, partial [Candidatus Kaiserbacteria bacterium]